jgi:hypothetical protein
MAWTYAAPTPQRGKGCSASRSADTGAVRAAPDTGLPGLTILGPLPDRGAWRAWRGQAEGRVVDVLAQLPQLDPLLRARERQRLAILATIRQEHLLPVLAAGTSPDGRRFVVAAASHGPTLAEWTARHGALPPAMAVGLIRRLAAALAPAHERGVIHRALDARAVHLEREPRSSGDPFPFAVRLAGLGLAPDPGDESRDDPREDLRGLAGVLAVAVGGLSPASPDVMREFHAWLATPDATRPVGSATVMARCDALLLQVAPAWRTARRALLVVLVALAILAWWLR